MFGANSKADRIIASNSGTYTLPSFNSAYPFGLKGTEFREEQFKDMFSRNLILLIGEQDDDTEQRGTMLHTPSLDKQGLGRLSRGKSFYKESMMLAKELGTEFDWSFCTVQGVGHDYREMGKAAAELLYGSNKCATNQ